MKRSASAVWKGGCSLSLVDGRLKGALTRRRSTALEVCIEAERR